MRGPSIRLLSADCFGIASTVLLEGDAGEDSDDCSGGCCRGCGVGGRGC